MGKPYSLDLRERVIADVEAYGNVRRVGAKFSVSPSFVVKQSQAKRSSGSVAPKPQGGDHRSAPIEAHRDWLLDLVRETVDLTLSEIRESRQRARAGGREGGAGVVAAKPTQP